MNAKNNHTKVMVVVIVIVAILVMGYTTADAGYLLTGKNTLGSKVARSSVSSSMADSTLMFLPISLDEKIDSIAEDVIAGKTVCGDPGADLTAMKFDSGYRYVRWHVTKFPEYKQVMCKLIVVLPSEKSSTVFVVYLNNGDYTVSEALVDSKILKSFWKRSLLITTES